MSTVTKMWEMQCPNCGFDTRIDISAQVYVRLLPDGTSPDEAEDSSHVWDNSSTAVCYECGHVGTVETFSTNKE